MNSLENPVFHSSAFTYLTIYSKVAYYTLISPCLIVIKENKIHTNSNRVQKFFCGLGHIYALGCYTRWVYVAIYEQPITIQENPGQLYEFATFIATLINVIAVSWFWWFKLDDFKCLVDQCYKISIPGQELSKKEKVALWICFLSELTLLSYVILQPTVEIMEKNGFQNFYKSNDLRLVFWQYGRYFEPYLKGKDNLEKIFSFLSIITYGYMTLFDQLIGFFAGYFVAVLVFKIGQECSNYLNTYPSLRFDQVVNYYTSIRHLMRNINSLFGWIIFGNIMCTMAFFSSCFIQILDPGVLFTRTTLLCYLLTSVSMFYWAAEGCSKMEKFREYFFIHRSQPGFKNNVETLTILAEISARPLGLHAFKFLITYKFIIKVFSTVSTYVVVLLQFNKNGTTPII